MKRVIRFASFLNSSGGGLSERVLRSGVWVSVSSVAQNVLQTVRSIVLAHLLAPEMLGLIGLCMVVIRGLELFTETGIGSALIQRQEGFDEAKDTAFTMQVLRSVLLTALACLAAPIAAAYYDDARLTQLILVLAIAFPISGFTNITMVLLHKNLDFRRITVLDLLVSVVNTVVVITLAVVLRNAWALAIGHIVMVSTRVVLSYSMVTGRPSFRFSRRVAWELFRYGRFITGLTIALFLTTEVDNLVVGKILGFEALGYYALAYMLANLPATHLARVASRVLFPAYSSIQQDLVKLRLAYVTVLRLVGGLAVPAAVGMALLAPEILRVVYGEKWLPASGALRILAIFGAVRAVSLLGGYVLQAMGKPNVTFYLVSGKLVFILALLPFLTRRYGIEGAAWAVTAPQLALDAASVLYIGWSIGLHAGELIRVVGRICLASSVMAGVVLVVRVWLGQVGLAQLLFLLVVGIGAYAMVSLRELSGLYSEHLRPALARRAPVSVTG